VSVVINGSWDIRCWLTRGSLEILVQLMSVDEHQAGRHAGDTGPGGWAVGESTLLLIVAV